MYSIQTRVTIHIPPLLCHKDDNRNQKSNMVLISKHTTNPSIKLCFPPTWSLYSFEEWFTCWPWQKGATEVADAKLLPFEMVAKTQERRGLWGKNGSLKCTHMACVVVKFWKNFKAFVKIGFPIWPCNCGCCSMIFSMKQRITLLRIKSFKATAWSL